jgi:hypothetical protein
METLATESLILLLGMYCDICGWIRMLSSKEEGKRFRVSRKSQEQFPVKLAAHPRSDSETKLSGTTCFLITLYN